MKVSEIYKEYMVPRNLQEHMMRVAAFAEILLENWKTAEIDKDSLVKACVFHDIAKPMTFDLAKQAQFGMSEADIEKLAELQERIKGKYGSDEHHATVKICEDVGLSKASVDLVNNLEWKYIPRLVETRDIASLIPIYADMRVGPKGILTMEQRLIELRDRVSGEDYEDNVKNGQHLEQIIRENVNIDLNLINDEEINKRFDDLLDLEI
jgi:hypothetical protein